MTDHNHCVFGKAKGALLDCLDALGDREPLSGPEELDDFIFVSAICHVFVKEIIDSGGMEKVTQQMAPWIQAEEKP